VFARKRNTTPHLRGCQRRGLTGRARCCILAAEGSFERSFIPPGPPLGGILFAANEMIAGIVLAAGRSRRMGSAKALLTYRGDSFLDVAARTLRDGGCCPVIIVVGSEMEEVAARARRIMGGAERQDDCRSVLVVDNPAEESEQIDSLRVGLRALPADTEAVVVLPVDMPTATAGATQAVIDGYRRTGAPIALAASGERQGHPVLFCRSVWPELLQPDLPEGARSVIHRHRDELLEVQVDAVPADVDTPQDYQRLLENGR
jgi:CTP:molybdopterin cytidylyltransferase MocA